MAQSVNLATDDIVAGDNNINRNDLNQAFLATKQSLENTLNGVQAFDKIKLELPETAVIDSAGTASISRAQAYLSAYSGTADNLDNINITAGIPVFLRATAGHTLLLRDNSVSGGNIHIFSGGTLLLSGEKTILALKIGTSVSLIGDGDTSAGLVSYISESAVAGEDLTDRKAAYIDPADGKIYQIDIDAIPIKIGKMRGIVVGSVLAAATATLVTFGELNGFAGLTKHQTVYADSTAGNLTQMRPVPTLGGAQVAIAELGYARASDTIFVDPQPVQYNLRNSMAENDTLTLQHQPDPAGYGREVKAYLSESVPGPALAEFTSINQDDLRKLRNRTLATYGADVTSGGTASANAVTAGAAANAIDDNFSSTLWGVDDTSRPHWWKIDYGAGLEKTIRQVTITESALTVENRRIKDFTIEGSNDDSTWDTLHTVVGETTWPGTNTYPFANATAYRYYRVYVTDVFGGVSGWTSITEIEMMEVATWTNGPDKLGQSFTLASASDTETASLYLRKVGSPTGILTVRIETDNAGDPSGVLAHANATTTLLESALTASFADVLLNFTAFNLAAGTYHIVLSTDRAFDESNYVEWGAANTTVVYTGDLCTAGTASADSDNGNPAANAFDDNISTDWISGTVWPHWIEYDFGASKTISQWTYDSEGATVNRAPVDPKLQYWDGAIWQDADVRTGLTWTLGEKKTFQVAGVYTSQRWRIYATQNQSAGNTMVAAEIEMIEAIPYYINGAGKAYDGALWSVENVDFIFAIRAPGSFYPAQITVDWWSSTHADLVNRYDDGTGANLETQTTFKCTRVAGFSDLTVVVKL